VPGSLSVDVRIQIDDKEFRRLINSQRFVPVFNKHMSRQYLSVGEYAKRLIRKQIDSDDYAPLGVWQYIKGNSVVLRHTGALRDGFTYRFIRYGSGAVVGIQVKPTGTHSSGLSMEKIAEILHNGTAFAPTPEQRMTVAIQAAAAGAPPPIGPKKDIWVIPPRPFMRDALLSEQFVSRVIQQSHRALTRTFAELKRS